MSSCKRPCAPVCSHSPVYTQMNAVTPSSQSCAPRFTEGPAAADHHVSASPSRSICIALVFYCLGVASHQTFPTLYTVATCTASSLFIRNHTCQPAVLQNRRPIPAAPTATPPAASIPLPLATPSQMPGTMTNSHCPADTLAGLSLLCPHRTKTIPLKRYDTSQGQWVPSGAVSGPLLRHRNVSVLTWNVLDNFHIDIRTPALMAALREADADLVGLQEVMPHVHAALSQDPWIRATYLIPDTVTHQTILTRLPASQVCISALPDHTKKHLVAVDVIVDCRVVRFGTSHLHHSADERKSTQQRKADLRYIFYQLDVASPSPEPGQASRKPTASILVGDMNFDDAGPENAMLAPYQDVWLTLRKDTTPTCRFPMGCVHWIRKKGRWACSHFLHCDTAHGHSSGRLDRVFVRAETLRAVSIARVGTQPLTRPGPELFVSDHFGLRAQFTVDAENATRPQGSVRAGE